MLSSIQEFLGSIIEFVSSPKEFFKICQMSRSTKLFLTKDSPSLAKNVEFVFNLTNVDFLKKKKLYVEKLILLYNNCKDSAVNFPLSQINKCFPNLKSLSMSDLPFKDPEIDKLNTQTWTDFHNYHLDRLDSLRIVKSKFVDFSHFGNITLLRVENSRKLKNWDSLLKIEKLITNSVTKKLPSILKEIVVNDIGGKWINEDFSMLTNLQKIKIMGNETSNKKKCKLTNFLHYFPVLRVLELRSCHSLKYDVCPNSIESVKVKNCQSLEFIKFQEGNGLKTLEISESPKVNDEFLKNLEKVETVFVDFPKKSGNITGDYVQNMLRLKKIMLKNIDFFTGVFPDSVETMRLEGVSITSVSFSKLNQLTSIELENCKTIEDTIFKKLTTLESIIIKNCAKFKGTGFENFQNLKLFYVIDCESFGEVKLPPSLSKLKIQGSKKTTRNSIMNLENLTQLSIEFFSNIKDVDFKNFVHLERLSVANCFHLSGKGFHFSKNLKHLEVKFCNKVKTCVFPNTLEELIVSKNKNMSNVCFKGLSLKKLVVKSCENVTDEIYGLMKDIPKEIEVKSLLLTMNPSTDFINKVIAKMSRSKSGVRVTQKLKQKAEGGMRKVKTGVGLLRSPSKSSTKKGTQSSTKKRNGRKSISGISGLRNSTKKRNVDKIKRMSRLRRAHSTSERPVLKKKRGTKLTSSLKGTSRKKKGKRSSSLKE